jgi:dipeptidyl aminopeptidase/acylaminoacyl peptidase
VARTARISIDPIVGVIVVLVATFVPVQQAAAFDAAAAFGARPSAYGLSLSPDGKTVAYVSPGAGQAGIVYTLSLARGAKPRQVLFAPGNPERIQSCAWVADDRLVCLIYGVGNNPLYGVLPFTRIYAVNADGTNMKLLSTEQSVHSLGLDLNGGDIIDWLPGENGSLLMMRNYLPDNSLSGPLGTHEGGLGVDRIDTRTLDVSHVARPDPTATEYITDGRGTVRIMGSRGTRSGLETGVTHYSYRPQNSRDWKSLGDFNSVTGEGFHPLAVDHDLNAAYGLKKKDGRRALYTVTLDESLREQLVYARPDVDVSSLIRLGRRQHVVGATYVTDARQAVYLSSDVQQLLAALSRALGGAPIRVADSSADDMTMLIFAGRDNDPGVYYIFDRKAKRLDTFLVVRDELEGVKLATVKSISYPADDGVMVPGYLTLPPGRNDAQGLPGIVLPHGGPNARDEWGFDWLSQFFANRGFAVLQPEFRGSIGYGDTWFQQNGFHSWRIAIADILAAGHWLVSQGVDPAKLAIVGWSYGGYAALQSAVVAPSTFKAVIAIAPVTDLPLFREQFRRLPNYSVASDFVGEGPYIQEGSPIEHADRIKVPVLMFQGTLDFNVNIAQSERMAARLKQVGGRCELVTFNGLDHSLESASARTELLRKSDAFLRQALGL